MRSTLILNMTRRTYTEAIEKLNALQSNYAAIKMVRESGDRKNRMSLYEMQEWTRRIGYKPSDFNRLNIVHITGTKGKGSTAAFTSSILNQYSGKLKKVGLYTSPHLRHVRERIRINGKPITEQDFAKYFFEVWDRLMSSESQLQKFPHMVPGSMPGYFKFLTLLSFHAFMEEGCDTCIYEVGVGGELDSTNIIERPVVCGVSLLGIDHTHMLGNTIQEIAWNKGGIFKEGSPAYTVNNQPSEGLAILQERAKERNTLLTQVSPFEELDKLELGIAGHFQKSNASLAIALASEVLNKLKLLDEVIPSNQHATLPELFKKGLRETKWEGRCQTLVELGRTWYLDGAHTIESIEAASNWFKSSTMRSDRRKILVFNQQSRDAKVLLKHLASILDGQPKFDHVIFTTNVTWNDGSYSKDLVSINTSKDEVDKMTVQQALADEWLKIDCDNCTVHICPSIESAKTKVDELSLNNEVDIFVTGSLHLVGGLLVVFDGMKKDL